MRRLPTTGLVCLTLTGCTLLSMIPKPPITIREPVKPSRTFALPKEEVWEAVIHYFTATPSQSKRLIKPVA